MTMKKRQSALKLPSPVPIRWFHEEHILPGRTVTIVEVRVPIPRVLGHAKTYRGVSIRNPKDSPIPSDGVKFALTRAMQRARLPKAKRRQVWLDFLATFPLHHGG